MAVPSSSSEKKFKAILQKYKLPFIGGGVGLLAILVVLIIFLATKDGAGVQQSTQAQADLTSGTIRTPSTYDPQVIKATLSQKITTQEHLSNVIKVLEQAKEEDITDADQKDMIKKYKSLSPTERSGLDNYMKEGGKKKTKLNKKQREVANVMIKTLSIDSAEMKNSLTENMENAPEGPDGGPDNTNLGDQDKPFDLAFLADVNKVDFKVSPSVTEQMRQVGKFGNLKDSEVAPLYESGTDVTNATKFRGLAKTLKEVCDFCNGKQEKTLDHNQAMLDNLEQVKDYLKTEDYDQFKKAFKDAANPPPPSTTEELKKFNPNTKKFSIQDLPLLESLFNANDPTIKTNPHLASLCAILPELQTLSSLVVKNQNQTNDLSTLEQLLKLRDNHTHLIVDTELNAILNGSKDKVPPGTVITDYITLTDVSPVVKEKIWDAGVRLLKLLPFLNTTGTDKRIQNLKTKAQAKVLIKDDLEDLIVGDLTDVMIKLDAEVNASSPSPDKAAKAKRIDELFKVILEIKPKTSATTAADYLRTYKVALTFRTDKTKLIDDIFNRLKDVNCADPKDVSPFTAQIQALIKSKSADSSIVDNDIKNTPEDTFKEIVKVHVIPKWIAYLKAESKKPTFNTECNKWEQLIKKIHQIDPTNIFEKVKSLNLVANASSPVPLANVIEVWNLPHYDAIIEMDFNSPAGKLDFSAADAGDIISTLKTIQLVPQKVDILKADAIQGASLGILGNVILPNINKIETAYLTLKSPDATCNLIKFKNLKEVKDLGGLTLPSNLKTLKDKIQTLAGTFNTALMDYHATTNEANKNSLLNITKDLICFESSSNISDLNELSPIERSVVDSLLIKKYAKPLDFIQDHLERSMSRTSNESSRKNDYQILHKLGIVSKPWDSSVSDSLKIAEYENAKLVILNNIRTAFINLDVFKIPKTLVDLLDHQCDSTKAGTLAKLRNDLFYSFDILKPAFEKKESPDTMKLKIMQQYHMFTMKKIIGEKSRVLSDDASIADFFSFWNQYLSISQAFKDSLPDCIKGIKDKATLTDFFDTHLPNACYQFPKCLKTIAKDQLLAAIINDQPKDQAISDLNKCIKERLFFGSQNLIPDYQRIAESDAEINTLMITITNDYLYEMEAKLIAPQLVDRISVGAANLEDELRTILNGRRGVYGKLKAIYDTPGFGTFEEFKVEYYRFALSIIGKDSASKHANTAEINASINLVKKFKQLRDLQSKEASKVLLHAELIEDLLSKLSSASEDSKVASNLRSKPTLSQALSELGTAPDPAKVQALQAFWKYKMAIWYLANRKYDELVFLRTLATKAYDKWDISFKTDIEGMKVSGKWIFDDDYRMKRGALDDRVAGHTFLFQFFNEIVKDFKSHDDSNPFGIDDDQQFVVELIENGTIEIVKEAIKLTDHIFELNQLRLNILPLKDPSTSDGLDDLKLLVNEFVEKGQVQECAKFLARQKLIDPDPNNSLIYDKFIRELVQKDLFKRMEAASSKLYGIPIIRKIYNAFYSNNFDAFPKSSELNELYLDSDYTKELAVNKEQFWKFWRLLKLYVNSLIKSYSFSSDQYTTLFNHLAYHQRLLIFLKRIELFDEVCKEGITTTTTLNLSTVYQDCANANEFSSPLSEAKQRYLSFLMIIEELENENFKHYEQAFSTGNKFIEDQSFNKFCTFANGISGDRRYLLVDGARAYVSKRMELFNENFINDPIQIAITSMMDAKVDFVFDKLRLLDGRSPSQRDASKLFSDTEFSEFENFRGEPEPFLNLLVKVGGLDQKYEEAFYNLLVKIDESEPVLPIKAAKKPKLSKFLCFAKYLSILRRLENLAKPSSTSSAEERIQYCYFYKTLDCISTLFATPNTEQDLLDRLEIVKDCIFTNEHQRPFLDKYVQVHRLTALFKEVTDTGTPILERSSDGKQLNMARIEPAEVGDEIEKMPIMSDPSFRSALAGFINDNKDSIIKKKIFISNELQHTVNPDISPDLDSYKDLLDEEVRKRVYDLWITL